MTTRIMSRGFEKTTAPRHRNNPDRSMTVENNTAPPHGPFPSTESCQARRKRPCASLLTAVARTHKARTHEANREVLTFLATQGFPLSCCKSNRVANICNKRKGMGKNTTKIITCPQRQSKRGDQSPNTISQPPKRNAGDSAT